MAIAIVSANTGNGHRAVMNALLEEFKSQGYNDIVIHDSFYEKCLISNKILSDFYNFLLTVSIPLGEKYTEFAAITRPDMSDEIYNASYEKLCELIEEDNLDAIISTAPLINYSIVRILREKGFSEKISFYIVVTDPYDPIAPGFDAKGATRYFCFSLSVKNILLKEGINEKLITVTSFPVTNRFLKTVTEAERKEIYSKLKFDYCKKTVLINSGAYGNNNFLHYLKQIHKFDDAIQIIFICGKNKALKANVENYIKYSKCINVLSMGFVDNLEEFLEIANVCIAKAGASTFYEAIAKDTFFIVDAVEGFLYQERGVKDIIEKDGIGDIAYDYANIQVLLQSFFLRNTCDNPNSCSFSKTNGAAEIVRTIIELL